jgi:hypothetical protein
MGMNSRKKTLTSSKVEEASRNGEHAEHVTESGKESIRDPLADRVAGDCDLGGGFEGDGEIMKKKTIRIGMKVRSVYDPERVFTIFREKGSRRWYGSFELEAVSSKAVKLSTKNREEALRKRSEAFIGHPPGTFPSTPAVYDRTCLNCGTEFKSENKNAKFCQLRGSSCRTQYWRRLHEVPEVPVGKDRLRSERVA